MTGAEVAWLPGHGDHEAGDQPPEPYAPDGRLTVRNVAGIVPEAVEWLWMDRVPAGVVTALAGDGGLGKSTLTMLIAAQITRGEISGKTGSRRVGVLLCEDSPSAVIRPRLAAAGADLEHVDVLSVRRDGIEAPLSLPDDLDKLRDYVQEHRPELLIADPVMGLLGGGVDAHRDGGKGGIRAVLGPLHRIAEDAGTTVVAVFHLNKTGGPSGQRIGGSAAIRNAVRNVLMLAPHPDSRTSGDDDGRRLIGHEKSNYGQTQSTLDAVVESAPVFDQAGVPLLRPDGEPITTARMVLGEESDVDYRHALASASADDREGDRVRDHDALAKAVGFVRDELADGPTTTRDLMRSAGDAGHAWRTVERAMTSLGVTSAKHGKTWVRFLPSQSVDDVAETSPTDAPVGLPGGISANPATDSGSVSRGGVGGVEPLAEDWEAAL